MPWTIRSTIRAARSRQTAPRSPRASAAARNASTLCMLALAPRYASSVVQSALKLSRIMPAASSQKCCSTTASASASRASASGRPATTAADAARTTKAWAYAALVSSTTGREAPFDGAGGGADRGVPAAVHVVAQAAPRQQRRKAMVDTVGVALSSDQRAQREAVGHPRADPRLDRLLRLEAPIVVEVAEAAAGCRRALGEAEETMHLGVQDLGRRLRRAGSSPCPRGTHGRARWTAGVGDVVHELLPISAAVDGPVARS